MLPKYPGQYFPKYNLWTMVAEMLKKTRDIGKIPYWTFGTISCRIFWQKISEDIFLARHIFGGPRCGSVIASMVASAV